jgi:hypothetical protein
MKTLCHKTFRNSAVYEPFENAIEDTRLSERDAFCITSHTFHCCVRFTIALQR